MKKFWQFKEIIFYSNLIYFNFNHSFSINPDPRGFQTVWGSIIGSVFSGMPAWAVGQAITQRVVAARSLKHAKK